LSCGPLRGVRHWFLAYTFPPAVSSAALKKMNEQVRRWRIHLRTGRDLDELAAAINPIVAGWMNYYGRFYRSRLYPSCSASTPT
jgi:hypothetical protein